MNDAPTSNPSMARKLMHTRNIKLCGYQRTDGLWDIEAQLIDSRSYDSGSVERGTIPAGESVHDLMVCVTVDDNLVVQSITSSMTANPFQNCPGALPPLAKLQGASLGPGWRRAIEMHLGQDQGCTHIREMLLQVATTAYQTIPVWFAQKTGDVVPVIDGKPPQHLGQCHAWSLSGPVVARLYPQFFENNKNASDN